MSEEQPAPEPPISDRRRAYIAAMRTHFQVAENTPACVEGGDRTQGQVWGHWITNERADVDCEACIEWMHA